MTISRETSKQEQELEEDSDQSRHITRGIGSLTFQNLGTSALGFVFLAVLLRLLPNVDYGVYSAVSISVGIASVIAPMGLQFAAAKYLADVRTDGEEELMSRAKKILILALVMSSLVSGGFVLIASSLSQYFTKSPEWSQAFVLGGLWLFSSSLSSVLQGTVQGLKKYASLAGMLFVARAAMVALTIIGLELYHNIFVSFYAWLVYFALIIFWSVRILVKNLPHNSDSRNKARPSLGYRAILKYSLPLGVAGIFFVLTSNADLVIVGGDLNSTSLGVYNTAVTISNVLTFVLITPLITALLPEASSRIHDLSEISNGLRLAIRFVILAVLPASFLVAALAPQLLELFSGGIRYLAGSEPLQIIAVFYVLLAIQIVIYSLLQATGNTFEVFLISAVTTVSIFGLSILLIPHFGLTGASMARSISAIVGMLTACYVARGFLKNLDSFGFYVKASLSAIIPFIVVWSLTRYVSSKAWTMLPYSLIGIAIFTACIFLLNVLSAEDKAFFYGALPVTVRRRLQSYSKTKTLT